MNKANNFMEMQSSAKQETFCPYPGRKLNPSLRVVWQKNRRAWTRFDLSNVLHPQNNDIIPVFHI